MSAKSLYTSGIGGLLVPLGVALPRPRKLRYRGDRSGCLIAYTVMRRQLHLQRRLEGVQIHAGILEGEHWWLLCTDLQEALCSDGRPDSCGMRFDPIPSQSWDCIG